jgi:hypothetical protein
MNKLTSFSYNLQANSISSGFYAGIGAGMERLNGKRNEWLEADPISFDSQTFTHDRDIKKNGHLSSLFGGYLYRYQNFAIAGEVFYEFGKVEDKIERDWIDQPGFLDSQGFYAATIEKKNGFGFRANIGGIIAESNFVYGLIGISATQVRYNSNHSYLMLTETEFYKIHGNVTRKLAYGIDCGLGVQRQLGQWRIAAETYVRTIKMQSLVSAFEPRFDPHPIVHAKFKPSVIGLAVKVILTF